MDYTKLKLLGEGVGSKVYLINYNEQYAVLKELKSKRLNEIEILEKISKHPNCYPTIVCIYEHFTVGETIFIIEEFIDGVTLRDYTKLNFFTHDDIVTVMKQLINAVEYLHRHNVAHRDIKLENVMLNLKHHVKLIDFDYSCIDECKQVVRGTPNYLSLELVNNVKGNDEKDQLEIYKKSDVYALGILFYYLIHNEMPYPSSVKTLKDVVKYIKENELTSTSEYPDLDKIVNVMLIKDYKDRPSILDVKENFKMVRKEEEV